MPRDKIYWMTDEEYKLVTKKTPIPGVDLVILKEGKKGFETLLIVRKTGYNKGKWCLIGGRVWIGETLDDTIKRQAKEMGIEVEVIKPFSHDFPAWIYDGLEQDETKQSLTHVYPVKIFSGEIKKKAEEYSSYKWFPVDSVPKLAFDQNIEVKKVLEQLKKYNV